MAPQGPHYCLVTACMNRDQHLRQVLPEWLKLPLLNEVLIVDWSNHSSMVDLCSLDPRIRVIRIEDEPKWILSYAYNIGISKAKSPFILKCDADCLPRREVVMNAPGASHFFAGFWQSGAKVGKSSVNGQCIFSKAQFEAVNGYNEYIRTYGRDDEDFYDRLIEKGFQRREIPPAQLDFLDHSNEARMANQTSSSANPTLEEWLAKTTAFNEAMNFTIGKCLPWGPASRSATYVTLEQGERFELLRREKDKELVLPPEVREKSRLTGLRYMATQFAGLAPNAANNLDEKACLTLLRIRTKLA